MNAKRPSFLALVLAASFGATIATADGPPSTNNLAVLFGKNVSTADLGSQGMTMLDLIWREVGDCYAKSHYLVATDQECEAYEKWQSQAEERDREKRKREFSSVEQQLKSEDLSEAKRNQLEEHRKTLLKAESLDADFRKISIPEETGREIKRNASRQWVTGHKVYRAIYEQYGGKVATTAFGLYPIEARRKLIEEHMRAGDIRFLDAGFEAQFWKDYEKGGQFFAEKDQIDFTPYWLKPIPKDVDQ
jgi:hypothetical protein